MFQNLSIVYQNGSGFLRIVDLEWLIDVFILCLQEIEQVGQTAHEERETGGELIGCLKCFRSF